MMAVSQRREPSIGAPPVAQKTQQQQNRSDAAWRSLRPARVTWLDRARMAEGDGGDSAVRAMLSGAFRFEPLETGALRPVILSGGSAPTRNRVMRALAGRMQTAGRRVTLAEMDPLGDVETPCEGVPAIRETCADALVHALNPDASAVLSLIGVPYVDEAPETAGEIAALVRATGAEVVHLHDQGCHRPSMIPNGLSIRRMVVGCALDATVLEGALSLAKEHDWAFAGYCARPALFHSMTAAFLADRCILASA